jgi:hypothetical protein
MESRDDYEKETAPGCRPGPIEKLIGPQIHTRTETEVSQTDYPDWAKDCDTVADLVVKYASQSSERGCYLIDRQGRRIYTFDFLMALRHTAAEKSKHRKFKKQRRAK